MRIPVFVALLFICSGAFANVIGKGGPVLKNVAGNVWEVVHNAGNTVSTTRTWAKGTEIGSAKATDVFTWVYREKNKIPLTATSTVGSAAVGRVAAKLLPIVGQASLAYDIWTELGCKWEDNQIKCDPGRDPDPDGPVSELYRTYSWAGYSYGSSAESACTASGSANGLLSEVGNGGLCLLRGNPTDIPMGFAIDYLKCGPNQVVDRATWTCVGGTNPEPCELRAFDGKCKTGEYVPKSEDEAGDHYGKNAGKVPGGPDRAPGVVQEGVTNGVPVPSSPPQVSGPGSVTGPSSSSTTTTPTGQPQTTTTNTTYNFTYNGSQITVNETTTTTNPDGSTTTTTTDETPPDVAPPSDPDMPSIPTLYEKKYPDGPPGVWNTRKAELLNTPIFAFLASLVPSTGDGGCPSWQLPVMYGIGNTATVDISIPCWIWSAIRAIFIVTALLSCRRIIFGG